jgi:hypothetical protein
MGVYFPQAVVSFRILFEDYGNITKEKLQNVYVFNVIPKMVKVNINSYREADEFECEIDYKYFPFDPRSIRSCGVTVHIEDRKRLPSDLSQSVLKPTKDNILFQGFVDEDHITLDQQTRTVKLEGRDFTSMLTDKQYFERPLTGSETLDKTIQRLIDTNDDTRWVPSENRGIEVVNRTGAPLITFGKVSPDLGNKGKSGRKNSRRGLSYWDIIQNLCSKAGLVAYIEIDKLIVTKPRNLFNKDNAKLFIYGKNVTSLDFKRKIGRQKNYNVKVTSYNSLKKKVITALIPKDASKEWRKEIGIPDGLLDKQGQLTIDKQGTDGKPVKEPAPYLSFRVKDVTDQKTLVETAESIYEQIGRQQIEGKIQTKEMVTCNRDETTKFDILKLRVGTPLEISIDQGDMKGIPDLLKTGNKAEQIRRITKFLTDQRYPERVAGAMAEALTRFSNPFFTKAVSYTMGQDGFTADIEFLNFIEIDENLVK